MRKGQSTAEYILVVFVFISAIIFLYLAVFSNFPGVMSDVRRQTSCLRTDMLANNLLKSKGIPENWERLPTSGGQIVATEIGFSTGALYDLNYTKWEATNNLTYLVYSSTANTSFPFRVSYRIDSLNWSRDPEPNVAVQNTAPNVYIMRDFPHKVLGVMAGTDALNANISLDLLFVLDNFTVDSSLSTESFTRYTWGNSSGIRFTWQLDSAGERQYLNFTAEGAGDRIYIRQASCVLERGSNCNITVGPDLLVIDEFGGLGFDEPETICSVKRETTMSRSRDVYGMEVLVEVK